MQEASKEPSAASRFDDSELSLVAKRPFELNEKELDAFEQMVVKGGEIDPDDLTFRLLNADHLLWTRPKI